MLTIEQRLMLERVVLPSEDSIVDAKQPNPASTKEADNVVGLFCRTWVLISLGSRPRCLTRYSFAWNTMSSIRKFAVTVSGRDEHDEAIAETSRKLAQREAALRKIGDLKDSFDTLLRRCGIPPDRTSHFISCISEQ